MWCLLNRTLSTAKQHCIFCLWNHNTFLVLCLQCKALTLRLAVPKTCACYKLKVIRWQIIFVLNQNDFRYSVKKICNKIWDYVKYLMLMVWDSPFGRSFSLLDYDLQMAPLWSVHFPLVCSKTFSCRLYAGYRKKNVIFDNSSVSVRNSWNFHNRRSSLIPIYICHRDRDVPLNITEVVVHVRYYKKQNHFRLAWSRRVGSNWNVRVQTQFLAKFHPDRSIFGRMATENPVSAHHRGRVDDHAYGIWTSVITLLYIVTFSYLPVDQLTQEQPVVQPVRLIVDRFCRRRTQHRSAARN